MSKRLLQHESTSIWFWWDSRWRSVEDFCQETRTFVCFFFFFLTYTGCQFSAAWKEMQENVSDSYTKVFHCLRCAPGCAKCKGPEPCLATYNWPFRYEWNSQIFIDRSKNALFAKFLFRECKLNFTIRHTDANNFFYRNNTSLCTICTNRLTCTIVSSESKWIKYLMHVRVKRHMYEVFEFSRILIKKKGIMFLRPESLWK